MNLTAISRYISLILRHKPEVIGIRLDEHGWADVDALIQGIQNTKEPAFSRELLDEIVCTDSKQRYAYNEDRTLIRASQGHSIPVDVELTQAMPPEILWHGTGEKYTASIEKIGNGTEFPSSTRLRPDRWRGPAILSIFPRTAYG